MCSLIQLNPSDFCPPDTKRKGVKGGANEMVRKLWSNRTDGTVWKKTAAGGTRLLEAAGAGVNLDGIGSGQRRADLVAVYCCQIRSGVSVSSDPGLSDAVSSDLRDRPIHGIDRRGRVPGVFPPKQGLRHLPLGAFHRIILLVRRVRICRRHRYCQADKLPRQLDSRGADAILGAHCKVLGWPPICST